MAGVYISYPFCAQKCTFCNFASGVTPPELQERYRAVLLEEIRSHEWQWLPETLYFGGGTPSLMPVELLRQISNLIPAERLAEVTLECAPGTVNTQSVRAWRDCGINRVSLGVQSFVEGELRDTGRRHRAETVSEDVATLRCEGLTNINVDLIAGLPGQTHDSWDKSLDWVEKLAVPHVSVYIFEQDEDSRLGKELLLGGVRYGAACMPSDDAMAEFYGRAVERLSRVGIQRYEISNFARRGFESRHNLKYWRLEPYVGFGADAHSYAGTRRWSNPEEAADYVQQSGAAVEVSLSDPSEEHFFVGLRLSEGIEPTAAEWIRFARPIERWVAAGMLERCGERLRLSDAGVLYSNEVFQEFVNAG